MTQTFYVPGTDETDPKKIIMSLQQIAAYLTKANFNFPATESPSTDPNTLDDYEEGTWTPTLSFVTPGDLTVTYTNRIGLYTKIGRMVFLSLDLSTSGFTHTTAAGALTITGLPFTSANLAAGQGQRCAILWSGITKAGYTDMALSLPANSATLAVAASGSGVVPASIAASDMPTGGSVRFSGTLPYYAA